MTAELCEQTEQSARFEKHRRANLEDIGYGGEKRNDREEEGGVYQSRTMKVCLSMRRTIFLIAMQCDQQAEAAKIDAAIATNLKELSYGG